MPSDGWEELSGSYFCHTHSAEGEDPARLPTGGKLEPKDGDCLLNSAQLIIRGSALDKNKVVVENKVG